MDISVGKRITANHFIGPLASGGVLIFEEHRLKFKPHPVSTQKQKTIIKYSEIDHAAPSDSPCPTFMSVFTKDGQEHRFAVWHRDDVIAFINRKAYRRNCRKISATPTTDKKIKLKKSENN